MWSIVLLMIVWTRLVQCSRTVCTDDKSGEPFKNCTSEVVSLNSEIHLRISCQLYVFVDPQDNQKAIAVAVTFQTEVNNGSGPNTGCLKLVYGLLKKFNATENMRNLLDPYNVSPEAFAPLANILILDLRLKFETEVAVGSVTYDAACVRDAASNQIPDTFLAVSKCVDEVRLSRTVAKPENYATYDFGVNETQHLSKIVTYFRDVWLGDLNRTVQSVTLTHNSSFEQFTEFKEFITFQKFATILNLSALSQAQVESLHFPNNGFMYIRNGDFPSMPTLQTLDFSGCLLRTIDPLAFDSLPNLVHLNLAGNRLQSLPPAVVSLIKLKTLNFRSNVRDSFSSGFNYAPRNLSKLTQLQSLDLSRMKLISFEEIDRQQGAPLGNETALENIRVLNLSWTSLHKFPRHLQSIVPNVQTLILSDNDFTVETANFMLNNNWTELRSLDLSGNQLDQNTDYNQFFKHFPNLRNLNLANNRITEFSPLTFQPDDEEVRYLNLSHNVISSWNGTILANESEITVEVGTWRYLLRSTAAEKNCVKLDTSETETFRNCVTELTTGNSTRLRVTCHLYALIHQTDTNALLVSATFQTSTEVMLIPGKNPTDCLKLVYGLVKKINPAEYHSVLPLSARYFIIERAVYPFTVITNLDLRVKFHASVIVGSVTYNASCIRELVLGAENGKHSDVSRCVDAVRVFVNMAKPGPSYMQDFASEQLRNVDAFSRIFTHFRKIWLRNFNGSVQSLNLTLPKHYETFPNLSILLNERVKDLLLPNNGFKTIRQNDMPAISTIKVLDLSGCMLRTVHPSAFNLTPNIVHLNMAGNQLRELPEAVAELSKLEILNVNSNDVQEEGFNYKPHILKKLSRLKSLDLSWMKLNSPSDVDRQTTFSNDTAMENLQVLNLGRSSIDQFPKHLQNMVPNLRMLILSDNFFTPESVKSLFESVWAELRTLDLSYNRLDDKMDFNLFFKYFSKLRNLNLANNLITEFPRHMLLSKVELQLLNLSGNNIRTWNDVRLDVGSDFEMDLSENNITEIHPSMLKDFSRFRYLRLSGVPLNCNSCFLKSFQDWLTRNETPNDFETSPYRCASPKANADQIVTNVTIDPELCVERIYNWLMNIVIPLISMVLTAVIFGTLVFHYRWHLRYFWHLFRAKFAATRKSAFGAPIHRYDAFVSYCSQDQNFVVQHLIPSLEQQEPKLHLCIHERDFMLGDTIINNVIDCIDSSRKSIFLISKKFIQSQWCQWELQMAQHKLFEEKVDVLVLILLEELVDKDIPRVLKKLMSSRTYLMWPGSENTAACKLFWSRLRHSVGLCHCLRRPLDEGNDQLTMTTI